MINSLLINLVKTLFTPILGPVMKILGPVGKILGPVGRVLGPVVMFLAPVVMFFWPVLWPVLKILFWPVIAIVAWVGRRYVKQKVKDVGWAVLSGVTFGLVHKKEREAGWVKRIFRGGCRSGSRASSPQPAQNQVPEKATPEKE